MSLTSEHIRALPTLECSTCTGACDGLWVCSRSHTAFGGTDKRPAAAWVRSKAVWCCIGDAHLRQSPTDPDPGSALPDSKMLDKFLMSAHMQDLLATWVGLMTLVRNTFTSWICDFAVDMIKTLSFLMYLASCLMNDAYDMTRLTNSLSACHADHCMLFHCSPSCNNCPTPCTSCDTGFNICQCCKLVYQLNLS